MALALSVAEGDTSSLAEQHVGGQPPGAAEQATQTLLALGTRYRAASDPATRAQLLSTLTAAADARQQLLATLIEEDPGAVLRVALPAGLVAGLPAAVQALVEEEANLEGTLEVLHEDRTDGSRYLYFLETANERLSLHFAADPPELLTGSHVRVPGVRITQALALDSGATSVQTLAAALPNTFGAQSTLVMLVDFPDSATQPYTPSYVKNVVFNTTSQFDMENSYGQTWLTGDVVGWYTIPLSSTTCDYSSIGTSAKQAATAAGVNLSSYNRYVYVFPTNGCGWSGLGTVGGNPSEAWINGSLSYSTLAHELGHNLGLYHSHSLDCAATSIGGTCTTGEYGDTADVMGALSAHFNAFQKERLGWLNYSASPAISTVTAPGTYLLDPYELLSSSNPKAPKILKSTDQKTGQRTWYYVEYRQETGFDYYTALSTNMASGVLIHLGTEGSGNSSYLLDMTPETVSWFDPALLPGKTFADADSGVTITPASIDSTTAAVTVNFGSMMCVRVAPGVGLTPSQSQWVAAGSTVAFTVTVTNNDNAACQPTTFSVQATPPDGWTVTFGNAQLTVTPGANASTTLTVTSPATASDGFYTLPVTATDATTSAVSGTASATYVIASVLTVSVSTDRTSYSKSQPVTITSRVSSGGGAVSGATVTVAVTKPSGTITRLTTTTDATGLSKATLRLKRQDPAGVYQVQSTASASSAITGQASTSFLVQ